MTSACIWYIKFRFYCKVSWFRHCLFVRVSSYVMSSFSGKRRRKIKKNKYFWFNARSHSSPHHSAAPASACECLPCDGALYLYYFRYFRLLADHDPATRIALLSHVSTIWKLWFVPADAGTGTWAGPRSVQRFEVQTENTLKSGIWPRLPFSLQSGCNSFSFYFIIMFDWQ